MHVAFLGGAVATAVAAVAVALLLRTGRPAPVTEAEAAHAADGADAADGARCGRGLRRELKLHVPSARR
ncbi:hypothetical protein [Candidatus Frankia alpina]|uniref:hypothetical protein n=1 Tax=Candidatus Frankia alpina TaxID=2699483 RepID=UPI001F370002|nr:hypothetical protein [Candidatus Frankia alpina]